MRSLHLLRLLTVLHVEDDPEQREALGDLLGIFFQEVVTAADGAEALVVAGARTTPLDLLIADVVMPTLGGPALAKRLLRDQPTLKVIFVSGYADEAIGDRRMLEDGASFLQKPFTLDELLWKVRAVLDDRSAG